MAEEKKAIVYFVDEASIRSDYHSGTTWCRRGYTPTVTKTGARFGINMISAVSGEGHMRYMTIPGRFNADIFIKFLKQIVSSHDCPVLIVTDGHSAHKAKKVMKYLGKEERLLDIQLLPPYSPELNPVELIWSVLKSGRIGRMALKTKDQFLRAVSSGLKSIQRKKKMILGFFRAENTAYACLEKVHA
ncbi:IS630 family transposase [Endozoicomonas arenosclerae]|uniref:IS630 family transposase n=1 Tax=Endozoicomonas arenosclerae TaxID=1633495 RepID=UPI001FDF67E4|nr:IS630 family transposase [Endozoicomonas arenosclerae]